MLTKTAAHALQRNFQDYIPDGEALTRGQLGQLVFRATTELEIYHCGRRVGNDLQSGPYYCGDVDDFVAPVPGGEGKIVAVCARCRKKL